MSYWGIPPIFCQPLDNRALTFAPRSHPQSEVSPALPSSQPVGPTLPPFQDVGPIVPAGHVGQLHGETWREFLTYHLTV